MAPFRVPHRDEFSEVVGFRIEGPRRAVLFIPDIDSWKLWDDQGVRIEDELAKVDVAYLDGTFFSDGEIPGRDMSQFPHPRIRESMRRFGRLPERERRKIRFIHLNHSNPALDERSPEADQVTSAGFRIAEELEEVAL